MPPNPPDSSLDSFAHDVARGLGSSPKFLYPKYFYDTAGSELFELITEQSEYYQTRTEADLLRRSAPALSAILGDNVSVVELGSGSSAKTTILLDSFIESQDALHYLPIDISPTILRETADRLTARYPELGVTPIASPYESGLRQASTLVAEHEHVPDQMLVIFLGSSVGNMAPDESVLFLQGVRSRLESKDAFLIGFDLQKNVETLNAAYNDAAGVTVRFNRNVLVRINRELGGTFEVERFAHHAFYNEEAGRIEMHLRSDRDQIVNVEACGRSFELAAGETIHTENSYKYTRPIIDQLAGDTGFRVREVFTDDKDWFSLALFIPR